MLPKLKGLAVIAAGVGNPPAPGRLRPAELGRVQDASRFRQKSAFREPTPPPPTPPTRFGLFSKIGPRRLQDASKRVQDGSKMAQDRRRWPKTCPSGLQEASRCLQDASKTPQEPPKSLPRGPGSPKMEPSWGPCRLSNSIPKVSHAETA